MNARITPIRASRPQQARVALLGTGVVGSAVWSRLADWSRTPLAERLSLVHVTNSRYGISNPDGLAFDTHELLMRNAPRSSSLDAIDDALGDSGLRIVIDATASEAVAEQHAHWLASGVHVVTACKLGQGTSLARWHQIQAARIAGRTLYGDSATVGAGLPLLSSLRALQAGGDRILGIAGVLSGSMAWLCNAYDGLRPFSGFVRQARDAGYTEPDPREDLSGEDVRRKLLILARASGYMLDADAVQVESLVPETLAALAKTDVDAALPALDALLRERYADAYKAGAKLRFVARLQAGGLATVGMEVLPADDVLAGGAGTDNRVAIWSDRYRERPLVVQGPGAGANVTAAALLDDALAIQASASGRTQAGTPLAKNSSIGIGRWNT